MNIDYPIKFEPILKEKIWGGEKLKTFFGKNSIKNNIGESWELSGVNGDISIVANGDLKGMSLPELISEYKSEFLGKKIYNFYGEEFPLLIKLIDASDDLSVQLHPNDSLAKERHNSFGKTEMWYVLESDSNKSKIFNGFRKKVSKEYYIESLGKGEILSLINVDQVKQGDAFYIEAGTIHAIGKGVVIAEIQQTSDITYRIFDWDRLDDKGEARDLHTELALDALDFSKKGGCKVDYIDKKNVLNKVYSCKYFTTNKLNIEHKLYRNLDEVDSFVVYMCVEGSVQIFLNENIEKIKKGETVLIPANASFVTFITDINSSLLEVYI